MTLCSLKRSEFVTVLPNAEVWRLTVYSLSLCFDCYSVTLTCHQILLAGLSTGHCTKYLFRQKISNNTLI